MRPLNIKISAFGPYAGCTEIPMDELGSQGLYLITGDTGAGKTTIFDAICFALYGEASGPSRDTSMFRSKYADADTPTEVELLFSHNGKEYTVKRNPEYMRPAKKGGGFTKQLADATLNMPDGRVITKVRTVTTEIESLLGIDRDQFSQIVMLAQGDFMKLLLSDTKDRMAIFRELFKTHNYSILQKKLEEEYKTIYGQREDARKSVDQYIAGIMVDKDDVLSIEVDKAKAKELTTEDVIELLDKLTDQDAVLRDKYDEKMGVINKELAVVNNNIGVAKEIQKTEKKLKIAKENIEIEEPKIAELKKVFDEAKEALKEKDSLKAEATAIDTVLPDYDNADKLESEIETTAKEVKGQKNTLEELGTIREKKQSDLEKQKKELDEIKGAETSLEKIKIKLEKINEEAESIDELSENLRVYRIEQAALKEAQEDYKKKDESFKELNEKYEIMEQSFMDGQAGILADRLNEGEACPVCGSKTHPHKAHLSENVPTEKQLEAAKKKAEKARNDREESASMTGGLKKALEEKEKNLRKATQKQLKMDDPDEAWGALDDVIEDCIKRREAAEEEQSVAEKQVKRKKTLEKSVPKTEEEIESIKDEMEEMKTSLASKESTIAEKKKQLDELKKSLRFENKREAKKERDKLNKKADSLQKAYDAADEALKRQNEVVVKLNTEIKSLEKTIEDSEAIDIDLETEKKEQLDKEQKEIMDAGKVVASRIRTNEDIRRNVVNKSASISEIEKKLQWVKALSDTANGKINGKEKVMLETYVQMTYFDRIINRANLRFMTMSSGQYELIRMKEASNAKSQSGLDLGVIDHYNGSQRSVKTLSGGESFMASLSLALGLSDEIQSSAGGIQIDTMFVDEGFGSLDPEALDQAYRALAGLIEGNRLVGIISHVADLKERIDKQIVVTKEKAGGSYIKLNI